MTAKKLTCGVVFDSIDVLRAGSLYNPAGDAPWPAGSNLIGCGITIQTLEIK